MAFFMIIGMSAYMTLILIIESEDIIILPNFVGKDVVFALEKITDLGLDIKVKGFEYSSDIPKNHVIFQKPNAGEEIKKGRDVHIFISKGPNQIPVPDLTGQSIDQVRLILEEHGMTEGNIATTYVEDIESDIIISQYPLPGTLITKGRPVDLLISHAKRPVIIKMPELTGHSIDDAFVILDSYYLKFHEIKTVYLPDYPSRLIIEQTPKSGYGVSIQKAICLTVNRIEKEKKKFTSGIGFFRYRIPNGFLKRHILVRLSIYGIVIHLFDDFMKPGEEIWYLVPYGAEGSIFVYQDEVLVASYDY